MVMCEFVNIISHIYSLASSSVVWPAHQQTAVSDTPWKRYNVNMSVKLDKTSTDKIEELRRREEEELVAILSQKYGLPNVNLTQIPVDAEALRLIAEEEARVSEIAPYSLRGKKLDVAIRSPNSELGQKAVEKLRGLGYSITLHMASSNSLEYAWRHYKDISFAIETEAGVMDISGDEVTNLMNQLTNLKETRESISDALTLQKTSRTTRIMEVLLAGALANHASDIHIEPEDAQVGIRFRLDGVLTNAAHVDYDTYKSILVRIKLLSGLKINIVNNAQDGRYSVRIHNRDIEIRTSCLPGNYGESLVLRILDPRSISKPLEELGMHPRTLDVLIQEIKKPNGMILNTGPTGSGKTTTLYAFMSKVMDPSIKILTIEDPVEYHLSGIVQTQVDHKNYTFASGLRSALRQDPDIIMVGEIRDHEVAETAIHAALTGHLVFSTLHTNNAAGAFPRLLDIGVNANVASSAVNVVMAQRLLRTLDENHKKEVTIEGADRLLVDKVLSSIKDQSYIPDNTSTMWVPDVPEGEPEYRGRIAVYEVILTTPSIEDAIRRNLTVREIAEISKEQGLLDMHQDAVIKVLNGVTTISEIRRILGEPA